MNTLLTQGLLGLPRPAKQTVAAATDAFLCIVAVWLGYGIRVDQWTGPEGVQWWAVLWTIGLALPVFYASGVYRAVARFATGRTLLRACVRFALAYMFVFVVIGIPEVVPRSLGVLVPVLVCLGAWGVRKTTQLWLLGASAPRAANAPRVLVYGAGSAGHQLTQALERSREMRVCAFVDDDPSLHGTTIGGLRVSPPRDLEQVMRKHGITDVLLAMPSTSAARRTEIVRDIHALRLPLHVRTLPDLADIAQGRVQIDHVRELDLHDLLGRPPVAPIQELLTAKITGKVVLVTGAGGSIGSELCRQIARLQPKALVLVDVSEFALYSIHQELERLDECRDFTLVPNLGSVRDESQMRKILDAWRPDTIYHAAAYKHVPLVEHNPAEGIRNNTFGTLTMARLARECGVSDFVLISTDKAVRPTNVMGASKRLAEMVLQAFAQQGGATCFSMVRFGNVLGSSGSVVPLFRRQIRAGGPITLTHPEITRYFMTIPEAAQLVIQASAMATGGDVFLLDMGEPVRIADLARRMVELSGMTVRDASEPHGDIAIEVIGLRPGEKLFEELLIGDNPLATGHPRVMKGHEECLDWQELAEVLSAVDRSLDESRLDTVRNLLAGAVRGYRPEAIPHECQTVLVPQ
ncbi:nucleoside-diphosphate sugar epimerase/dehydratase [Ramlibacter tataouinensis]|uniref:polysaccharide biosynthesis protein n=1 Tax=Ramlibacter tataouinensis TaxID=94132 RepID=UPI0022F39DDB|nr:nucleoside-diphosphate sugar epimerase/dehydratase [Ramlibacter tataouinensis]WBY02087.1 nucleoside-diphosphate sugar epimerase/dehydratase [Ramlibacter tataouinensis]